MTDKTIIALIKPYDTRFSVFAHGDGGGRTVLEVDWATMLSGSPSVARSTGPTREDIELVISNL